MMKHYLANHFDLDKMVDVLDELPIWSAPFGLKLLDYVSYRPKIQAIDIGFGTGFPLTELAMRLGESSTVYGIDPWKEAIVRTNQKIGLYGIKNVRLIEGVAESIPLESGTMDLIVSNNGINNVTDMDKVFSECSRIMKTGGQFVQTMNLDKSMFEFYTELESVLVDMQLKKVVEDMHHHIYLKRRPLDEVLFMMQSNGFNIKDMELDQFNYKFTDGTAMLNHYFIRLAFMESWIKILPKDQVETIFKEVEQRLNNRANLFGGIKLSIPFVLINAVKR